jgi:hypothetical protein
MDAAHLAASGVGSIWFRGTATMTGERLRQEFDRDESPRAPAAKDERARDYSAKTRARPLAPNLILLAALAMLGVLSVVLMRL